MLTQFNFRTFTLLSCFLTLTHGAFAQTAPPAAATPPTDPASPVGVPAAAETSAPAAPDATAEVVPASTPPVAAEATATAAPLTDAPVTDAKPPAEPATTSTVPVLPQKLAVGTQGTFQPSALLQGWWVVTDSRKTTSTFRLRRAELKLKGTIIPELWDYAVMIDAAKTLKFGTQTATIQNQTPAPVAPAAPEQVTVPTPPTDTSILQDFYVTFVSAYSNVSLGQFKIPLSWEGYNSASQIIMPERALVSRTYGDRRDMGLRAEKAFGPVSYLLTVTNGTGVNRLDDNNDKDVALRVEVKPVPVLMVGAVGSSSVGARKDASTKDRVELDARAEVSNFIGQAEYIHAWDGVGGARKQGHGAYAAFAYTLLERIQPVLRAGFLDPDTQVSKNGTWHYEIGANYLIQKNEAKLQASFGISDPEASGVPAERLFILNAQAQF